MTINVQINFTIVTCGECGTVFALDENRVSRLRESHATFWCPNGHQRRFLAKTETEALRERLLLVEQDLDAANASLAKKKIRR